MQAAGVRRGFAAGIGDLERHAERGVGQAIFDGEREGERIDGARALVVAQNQADEVGADALDREGLEPGEAVQAERIAAPGDPGAVARPADDRIEDRADVGPDRRVARPQKIAVRDAPASRLGPRQGDRARADPDASSTMVTGRSPRLPRPRPARP